MNGKKEMSRCESVIRIASVMIIVSVMTGFTFNPVSAAPVSAADIGQEEAAPDESSCLITYDANGGGFFTASDAESDEGLSDTETSVFQEDGDQICSEIVEEGALLFNRCPAKMKAYDGQRFLGWSTVRDGSRIIPPEGIPADGDMTLYAVWENVETGKSGSEAGSDSGRNTAGEEPSEEWENTEGEENSSERMSFEEGEETLPQGAASEGTEYASETENPGMPAGEELPSEGMTSGGAEYATETENPGTPAGEELPSEGMTFGGAEYAAETENPGISAGEELPSEGVTSGGAEYAAETEIFGDGQEGDGDISESAANAAAGIGDTKAAGEKEAAENGTEEKDSSGEKDSVAADSTKEKAGEKDNASSAGTKAATGIKTAAAEKEKAVTGSALSIQGRRRFSRVTVRLSRSTFVYNGKSHRPSVTVRYGRIKLKKGVDYVVSYSRNVNAGKAVVKLVGRGRYYGVVTKYFRIARASQKMTVRVPAKLAVGRKARLKIGGVRETKRYYFKAVDSGLVKTASNGTVTARKVGTARITVSTRATRNYKAEKKTVSLRIVPGAPRSFRIKNLTSGFRLTWTKVAGASGYILYRNGKKIRTINKGSTTAYRDTAANCNGRKYLYKIIAKASTGTSTVSKTVTGYRGISYTASPSKKVRYCFEQSYVVRTLTNSGRNDLAIIDMDGVKQSKIKEAAKRGVQIYGYLNAGAMEHSRSYYSKFRHLRLAEYEGWDGEYWVDVTGKGWYSHLIHEAKKMKKAGAVGVYLDNTDIYYMVKEVFGDEETNLYRSKPSARKVYNVLKKAVIAIENEVGLVVMPNGGDSFVKKFVNDCPGVIKVVNQEGVLYMNNEKQSSRETKYRTDYLNWCKKKGIFVRGIEYTDSASAAARVRKYYRQHGWLGAYISRHRNLRGD